MSRCYNPATTVKARPWIWWLVLALAAAVVLKTLARPAASSGRSQLLPSPVLALGGLDSSLLLLTAGGDVWLWDSRGPTRRWRKPWHVSGVPVPSLCHCDSYVVLAALDGHVAVHPWAVVGEPWSADLGEPLSTRPAVGDGAVLLCGASGRACLFDLATGDKRAGFDLQAPACARPQWWGGQWWVPVRGNRVVRVSSEGKTLVAHGLDAQALATATTSDGVWV
ncbi:MAG: hypothetical protein J7M26_01865, partial [Armatimonadetes bacterium]|nr:hypothetical protein [Armatimonadota bacterium]